MRKDHAHKVSSRLARTYGAVATEASNVENMVKSAKGTADDPGTNVAVKSDPNRSLQDAGWRRRRGLIQYECALSGPQFSEVDPGSASGECRERGHVATENRRGERFRCVSCGHTAHADTNAALNMLHRAGRSRRRVTRDDAPGVCPEKREWSLRLDFW